MIHILFIAVFFFFSVGGAILFLSFYSAILDLPPIRIPKSSRKDRIRIHIIIHLLYLTSRIQQSQNNINAVTITNMITKNYFFTPGILIFPLTFYLFNF